MALLCLLAMLLALAGCGGGGSSPQGGAAPPAGGAPPSGGAPPAGTPPPITIQKAPASQAVDDGDSAVLDVQATSATSLNYQWQRNGVTIPGATGANYVTPALALADSGVRYTALVGNQGGATESITATITVRPVAPTITSQPQDTTVAAGQTTALKVQAQGSQPMTYQWQRNGVDIAGATSATFGIPSVATTDGARYRVVVRNAASQVVSNEAVLSVSAAGPSAVTMLQFAVVSPGQRMVISAAVTGTPPYTFRWLRNGQPIDGAAGTTAETTLTLVTPRMTGADDGVRYALVLDTAQGSLQYSDIVISVIGAPRVAAGESHSLARSADGRTVWAWGDNAHGQLGLGTTTASGTPTVVPGLVGVTAIATGDSHSLALKEDGTVWAWGQNSTGALGDGSQIDRLTPQRVGTLSGVVAIAAGGGRSFALRSDGSLWGWGENNTGALGLGMQNLVLLPTQVGASVGEFIDIVAVAAGARHTLALRSDGAVFAFGEVAVPLPDGFSVRSSPVIVDGVSSIAGVTAGNGFSVAVDIAGKMFSWGLNGNGQLGLGNTISAARPTLVAGSGTTLLPALGLAAGHDFVLERPLGGPYLAWGAGGTGQLGTGNVTAITSSPEPVRSFPSPMISLAAGRAHALAVLLDGSVYSWGANAAGQLGIASGEAQRTEPVQVPGLNLN